MNKELLLKLAEHLENGKLGHRVFDFATLNSGAHNVCGTNGCAMGELPILFPEDWAFVGFGIWPTGTTVIDIAGCYHRYANHVARYFDICGRDVDFLFVPGELGANNDHCTVDENDRHEIEFASDYGVYRLPVMATKDDVAKHIRRFVENHSHS